MFNASNALLILLLILQFIFLSYIFKNYTILDYNNHKKFIKECTKRSQVTNLYKPLNNIILSIIYGSLLGDGHAEKRPNGKATRITFYQESVHKEYLLYLHFLVASLGYCNTNTPSIKTRIGKNGKIRYIIRFATWTYDNFNVIHQEWYKNKIKIVPKSIEKHLTPLALAIWVQDDGGKVSKGLKLATNSFTLEDTKFLANLLSKKYKLKTSVQSAGAPNQYIIYIHKESMETLKNIIYPYVVKSMRYKID
uniref:Homing endonuclease LAGLIDADG domain-containing protein n=1 Tax=Wickerhamomyces mucosus TaxID=1378264 RepID=S5U565_9ASCO|nr:hypothetical protein [Wickerhamomyces mucosus]AGS44518.1 hypothetical protein [Wickerhamomyces mucosus]